MRRQILLATFALSTVSVLCAFATRQPQDASPQAAVDGLLAADRAFSAASMKTDMISGISAMFMPDVAMGLPGPRNSTSAEEVVAEMRKNPAYLASHAEWTPIRGGISADGTQGFTLGYGTEHRADNTTVPFKYLAYWVKGPQGWRVAAYKRRPRQEGDVSLAMRAPALPARMVAPTRDASAIERARTSLDKAERSFSDDAQKIGLDAAFVRWGTTESYNMGARTNPEWVVGSVDIGKVVATGEPDTGSSVNWSPDRVIVASSGDLGVTIGFVRLNQKPTDGSPDAFPFFTVWHRVARTGEWRYIAE